MYPHWSPIQPNKEQRNNMVQQSFNQGFFQFQQNFPGMWQQQQQQQGQFMLPNFVPFPNNVTESKTTTIPSNGNYMYAENNNRSSGHYQWQSVYSSERERENNKISYERNPNQEQYASYPQDAIYRHASGPGWQQQQIFYPANSFK